MAPGYLDAYKLSIEQIFLPTLSLMKKIVFLSFILGMITLKGFSQQPSDKVTIDRDGVNIHFTDNGSGDTTLLFVHGWAINQTYWSGQVDFFKDKYRVVTLDLPGFGSSGKNRSIWFAEEYGKDVSAVINQLDLKNVVLIGHSMAEYIIIEAAHNSPESVVGLIGVDNFRSVDNNLARRFGIKSYLIKRYLKSFRSDYSNVAGKYVQSLFYNRTDSLNRERVLRDFEATDSAVAVSAFEQNIKYTAKEKELLKALGKKVYLINSDYGPFLAKGFSSNGIAFERAIINETGHFLMIEKPAEFNSVLSETIKKIKADKE